MTTTARAYFVRLITIHVERSLGEYLNPLINGELQRHFSAGYSECIHEVLRYITEVEGFQMTDIRCVRMMAYLQNKGTNLMDSLLLTKKSTGIYTIPISHSVHGSCELASDSRSALGTVYPPQESSVIDSQYFNQSASTFPSYSSSNALNRCLGCSSLFKLTKSSSIGDRVPFVNKLVQDPSTAAATTSYPTHKTNYMITDMFPYNSVYSKHSLHLTSPISSYGIASLSKSTSLVSNSDSFSQKT